VKCPNIIYLYAPCPSFGQKRVKKINKLIQSGGMIGPGIGFVEAILGDADLSSISGEVWLKSKAR
jgi:hypothetical protein